MLDSGDLYPVQGTGRVLEAGTRRRRAVRAMVTRFSPQTDVEMEPIASFETSRVAATNARNQDIIFYAVARTGTSHESALGLWVRLEAEARASRSTLTRPRASSGPLTTSTAP